jgi:serine/threonine protein kinase
LFAKWRPPEEHRKEDATEKADVWALGTVLLTVLTGQLPYASLSEAQKLVPKDIPPEIPLKFRKSKKFVNRIMVQAIKMCLVVDPKERASAREVADFLENALKQK